VSGEDQEHGECAQREMRRVVRDLVGAFPFDGDRRVADCLLDAARCRNFR